jgi:hypothetical protein
VWGEGRLENWRGWALGTRVPSCGTLHNISGGRLACPFGKLIGPTQDKLIHTRATRETCSRDAVFMRAAFSLDEDRDGPRSLTH